MKCDSWNFRPHYNKLKCRATFRNKNASLSDIKSFISSNVEKIISNEHSVEEKWQELKKCIDETLNLNVPKKDDIKKTQFGLVNQNGKETYFEEA